MMDYLSADLSFKLKAIFGGFVAGKIPRDDALLEKVFSWLQQFLKDSASCEHFLCSTDFIAILKSIHFQLDVDSQVWAFLLRLSGHIIKHLGGDVAASGNYRSAVEAVFEETSEQKHLWCQASIRCAWLQGMQLMAEDHRLYGVDHLKFILECLEDRSWFVSKAAVSIVSQYLTSALKTAQNSLALTIVEHILGSLTAPTSHQKFIISMEILENACRDPSCTAHLGGLLPTGSLVGFLCSALEISAADKTGERRTAVLRVLTELWGLDKHRDEMCSKLVRICEKLTLKSCLTAAMETSAWILERYDCSSEEAIMLESICLVPLWISVKSEATDKDLSDLLPITRNDDCREAIVLMVNSNKSNHTTLVKLSLTILVNLKDRLIQSDIIYHLIKDLLMHLTDQRSRRQPLLPTADFRLKYSCLDILRGLIRSQKDAENFVSDFSALIFGILSKPNDDQMVVSKTFSLLIDFLKALETDSRDRIGGVLSQLLTVLQRNISDLNWDIRDTTVNFIEKLLSMCIEVNAVSKWASDINIVQYISVCLTDSEAYVRASALNALSAAFSSIVFRSEEIRSDVQNLWPEVLRLCKHDAVILSRRVAVDVICRCYRKDFMPSEREAIEDMMFAAIYDSDWEIKIKSVEFWTEYAKEVFRRWIKIGDEKPRQPLDLAEQLTGSGCVKSLLVASQDCDKSVWFRALTALNDVKKELLCAVNTGEIVTEMQNTCGTLEKLTEHFLTETDGELNSKSISKEAVGGLVAVSFDRLIDVESLSTDCHEGNPESLLEDLLKSLVVPLPVGSGFTSSEEEDDEGMTADCY